MRKTLVTDDEVARIAWDTYSKAVGGKAFNGDPLPTWDVMCKDEKKENLVVAWKRCARAVATHVEKKLPALLLLRRRTPVKSCKCFWSA
jgi:hypothetical protein